ncbi:MAG: DUF4407 domain-containing protein [Burkholderiales bacterium]|jgi:hypothetical protein
MTRIQAGRGQSLLLHLAGADAQLLSDADLGARRQVFALGLLLAGLAVLNGVAAAVAFVLLLQPAKAASFWVQAELYLVVVLAGLLWPLVVANLFRFAMASVGRPAGTPAPSIRTFLIGLLAKGVMAGVLGLTVAVPITILIIQPELRGMLSPEQELNIRARQMFIADQQRDRLENLYRQRVDLTQQEQSLRARLSSLDAMREAMSNPGIKLPPSAILSRAELDAQFEQLSGQLQTLQDEVHRSTREIAVLREQTRMDQEAVAREIRNSDSLWSETGRALSHARVLYIAIAVFMTLLHLIPLVIRGIAARTIEEHRAELQGEIVMARHGIEPEILIDGSNRVDRYRMAEALRDLKVKEYRTLREASARVRAERAQEIRSRILAQRSDPGA